MAPAGWPPARASSPSNTRAAPSKWSWSWVRPATFTTAPSRRQRAPQHDEAALGVERRVERVDDDAVRSGRVDLGQVLGHGPAGHRQHVAVQQAGVEQVLHHDGHAADAVEIGHVELAARLHVGDVGHAGRDAVEVVEVEGDPGLVGDGQQVEHGVGRAAERVGDRDGVLERRLRHDVPRGDAEAEQLDHRLAGAHRVVVAPAIDRRRGRRAGQRHADGLADRGHGVRREHAAARALARAGLALDVAQLVLGDRARARRRRPPRTRS